MASLQHRHALGSGAAVPPCALVLTRLREKRMKKNPIQKTHTAWGQRIAAGLISLISWVVSEGVGEEEVTEEEEEWIILCVWDSAAVCGRCGAARSALVASEWMVEWMMSKPF